MHEADRLAQKIAAEARERTRAAAMKEADDMAAYRRNAISQIRAATPPVLAALKAKGYPDAEPLTFQKKTILGSFKPQIRAGWLLGKFYVPESHSRGEGHEPLHLLADGSFAAFGHNILTLDELSRDGSDIWWQRKAPETILRGLGHLRDRYSS